MKILILIIFLTFHKMIRVNTYNRTNGVFANIYPSYLVGVIILRLQPNMMYVGLIQK